MVSDSIGGVAWLLESMYGMMTIKANAHILSIKETEATPQCLEDQGFSPMDLNPQVRTHRYILHSSHHTRKRPPGGLASKTNFVSAMDDSSCLVSALKPQLEGRHIRSFLAIVPLTPSASAPDQRFVRNERTRQKSARKWALSTVTLSPANIVRILSTNLRSILQCATLYLESCNIATAVLDFMREILHFLLFSCRVFSYPTNPNNEYFRNIMI